MTVIKRGLLAWGGALLLQMSLVSAQESSTVPFQQYLRESAVSRNVLDTFADPKQLSWAQFDPEVGYILGNYLPVDGIDGSSTISTVQPDGARTPHHYVGRKGRINTYGNSFTQRHQVNDGETWQEYLAAHLGEPIRNFGMGGFGVYQAYRRMLREERTDRGAEYVILYIWGGTTFAVCFAAVMPPSSNGGIMRVGPCSTTTSGPTWKWISIAGRS